MYRRFLNFFILSRLAQCLLYYFATVNHYKGNETMNGLHEVLLTRPSESAQCVCQASTESRFPCICPPAPTTYNETALSNALVAQKDHLLDMIPHSLGGGDLAQIQKATECYRLVKEVWHAVGYGYKVGEVRDRLLDWIDRSIVWEEEYLAGCRKNCKTRHSTERDLALLKALRSTI